MSKRRWPRLSAHSSIVVSVPAPAYDPMTLPISAGFRAGRVCRFPHIPSVRAAGVEPARAHAHQGLSLARLPVTPRPRAPPGPRTLNPLIKSQVHVRLCLQRKVGMTGLEPASSAPPARRSSQTELHPVESPTRESNPACLVGSQEHRRNACGAWLVTPAGIEPATCGISHRRSAN
jgi:hypothetical protein